MMKIMSNIKKTDVLFFVENNIIIINYINNAGLVKQANKVDVVFIRLSTYSCQILLRLMQI